jgi:hypothetical protein
MGKRELKNYLSELDSEGLREQLLDLYLRFPEVKAYYDFVFDPKEDKLVQEAKTKISNEYFPLKRRRPKARRSVAQKYIKHFIKLGVEPFLIADVMLYNLEVSQSYSQERNLPVAFYKSMLNSFVEAVGFISLNSLLPEFKERMVTYYKTVRRKNWPLSEGFSMALDQFGEFGTDTPN